MAEPFIGEIKIWANAYPPRDWAYCDGQQCAISQLSALFAVIGTTFGGDGRVNFCLPNLQGRTPMGPGAGPGLTRRYLGQGVGEADVALTPAEIPEHTHTVYANKEIAKNPGPDGNAFAAIGVDESKAVNVYHAPDANLVSMAPEMAQAAGGTAGHENRQPYLGICFCIALDGLFPQRP